MRRNSRTTAKTPTPLGWANLLKKPSGERGWEPTKPSKSIGSERPRPNPAGPGSVDAAVDQGGDGKREADREAYIAEVEQWRMDGETDVLQDRVEIAALDRRR